MSNLVKVEQSLKDILIQATTLKTLPDILQAKAPSLVVIKNKYTEEKVIDLVEVHLINTLEFFNVRQSMNDNQTKTTSMLIVETFYWFTLSDIYLCFKNAMKGDYIKLYGAIDGQVVLEWFKKYASARADEAEQLNLNITMDNKKLDNKIHPDIREAILKAVKSAKTNNEQRIKLNASKISQFEKDVFELFDKLHEKQGYPETGGLRIANHNGTNYTQESFMILAMKYYKRELKKNDLHRN